MFASTWEAGLLLYHCHRLAVRYLVSLRITHRTLIKKYLITSSESSTSPECSADIDVNGCQLIRVVFPGSWVAIAIPYNKRIMMLTA